MCVCNSDKDSCDLFQLHAPTFNRLFIKRADDVKLIKNLHFS